MTRREIVLVALGCGACGRTPRSGESLLPLEVAGVWQRRSLTGLSPAPGAARRAFQAVYAGGPGRLTADVYEMPSPAGALDLAQRWKPAADTVFFYKENYFAVVKWDRVERKALTEFVRALEKNLSAR